MDPKVAILLERDLEVAIESRDEIYQINNYEVVKSRYRNPSIRQLVLPLGHPDGLLVHHQKIIDILTRAKENELILKSSLPENCPRWLEDMVEGMAQ